MNINFAATFHAKDPSTSKEMAMVEYTPPSFGYNNSHPPCQGSYVLPSLFSFFCVVYFIILE